MADLAVVPKIDAPSVRPAVLAVGAAVVLTALSPPVHHAAGGALAAHMVQHVLLLTVAPPLAVIGLGLRRPSHHRLGPAVVVHSLALVGWHVPSLYEAALRSEPIHVIEHVSLFVAGVLLWRALGVGDGAITGASVLALFVAAVPGTLLGFAMTFAARPWYGLYPDLADQQLAGVIMWGPAGTAYAFAGGAVLVGWLRDGRSVS